MQSTAGEMEQHPAQDADHDDDDDTDTHPGKNSVEAAMSMEEVLDEQQQREEEEDKVHKAPIPSMEAEVAFQSERHAIRGAEADNPHKSEGKPQQPTAHEVGEDSMDEVGIHEGGNSPLAFVFAFAFAEVLAIECDMTMSQFASETDQELIQQLKAGKATKLCKLTTTSGIWRQVVDILGRYSA